LHKILTFNIPTWSSVVTAVSIPNTIAVYGNGKTMGFTEGSFEYGLSNGTSSGGNNLHVINQQYNTNVGTVYPAATNPSQKVSLGLVSDTSGKSGIVAKSNSITRTSLSMKFGIKY
jgi:hypothetical protein